MRRSRATMQVAVDEQAMAAQWETGRVTIRSSSGSVLRHWFSGSKVGKTRCGRYDVAIADVQLDDTSVQDCGMCQVNVEQDDEKARRKAVDDAAVIVEQVDADHYMADVLGRA